MGKIRKFATGATRDTDEGKLNFSMALCPFVLERYVQYLNKHRLQSDGKYRSWNNWKLGIDKDAYMDSLLRHVWHLWEAHISKGSITKEELEDLLCAIIFNSQGYLFELMRKENG